MWLLILSLVLPAYGAQCRHSSKRLACVEFIENYDGDTITFTIPRVFPLFGEHVRVRVAGIDAPEISSTKTCEYELAQKVKKSVRAMLARAKRIDLINPKRDKYFRILADIEADGVSLRETLLAKGWAIEYHGDAKPIHNWCNPKSKSEVMFDLEQDQMPFSPYQGEWKFSENLEPALHAHNVKLYLNNEAARERLKNYIADGYICEKRLGLMVLCRKILDTVVIPESVQKEMHRRASAMSIAFESFSGSGSLITEGETYREWSVPGRVRINENKYDSYIFSKSSSGLIKAMMGYDQNQKRYSFVAKRDALKYYINVVVEGKFEWNEYSAFAVFNSP